MNKLERGLLQRLMIVCNKLGSYVDRTAVSEQKLYEYQQAHVLVSNILYGILAQNPDNEYAGEDMNKAKESLDQMEYLADKEYPDRNGHL